MDFVITSRLIKCYGLPKWNTYLGILGARGHLWALALLEHLGDRVILVFL